MKFEFIKDSKCLCFAAGAAAVVAAKKLAGSEKVRKLCVSGLAKGMKLGMDAKETLQNIREDAADLCCEARAEACTSTAESEADE